MNLLSQTEGCLEEVRAHRELHFLSHSLTRDDQLTLYPCVAGIQGWRLAQPPAHRGLEIHQCP